MSKVKTKTVKKSVKKTAKHSVKENRFLTKVVRGFKNIMVSPFDK